MSEADGVLSEADGIRELTRDRTAVVLVTAAWCGPCLPAPTVLRELDRRWGGAAHAVLIEDAPEEVLDQLAIEVLPVWLQLAPVDPGADGASPEARDLVGNSSDGSGVRLCGEWAITERYDGALPKHVVDARFGPEGAVQR